MVSLACFFVRAVDISSFQHGTVRALCLTRGASRATCSDAMERYEMCAVLAMLCTSCEKSYPSEQMFGTNRRFTKYAHVDQKGDENTRSTKPW